MQHIARTWYDEAGRAVTSVNNLTGQAISVSTPPQPGTSDQNIRTDTEYAASGMVVSSTDAMGHVTKFPGWSSPKL